MKNLHLIFCLVLCLGSLHGPAVSAQAIELRNASLFTGVDQQQTIIEFPVLLSVNTSARNSLAVKDALTVSIAGQHVQIQDVRELRNTPLAFSMVVDVSGSTRKLADVQIAAAKKLFRTLAIGQNRGCLLLFGEKLGATEGFVGPEEAEKVLSGVTAADRKGGTLLYDAIVAATQQIATDKVPSGSRRAIFVFSDFVDTISHHSLDATLDTIHGERIPVFIIGPSMEIFGRPSREEQRELKIMRSVSYGSGGTSCFLNARTDCVTQMIAGLDSQVMLSVKAPKLQPKKAYSLTVAAHVKGLNVVAQTELVGQ